jgi:integrase
MPLDIYKRGKVWHYRGTIAGRRLRGSCQTSDRDVAARQAAEIEARFWKGHFDGPQAILTFAQAVMMYLDADKQTKYLTKIADYWKDTLVKDISAGAIRQSAIDIYPTAGGATRNRQVITPTQAVINHCADLELCPRIRIKRFPFKAKIKKPVTLEWLETFCAHARPLNVALSTCMFATACRISEARRVDWPDIDFRQRTILIRDHKTGKERFAHMPQPLADALANLPRDDKPFPFSESQLRRLWDEDVERAAAAVPGFERLTYHCCRHGFATAMLRDGVDPKTAAALGGWDDIGLFMTTYVHPSKNATLTDRLFDTKLTQPKIGPSKNKTLEESKDPSGGTTGRVKAIWALGVDGRSRRI